MKPSSRHETALAAGEWTWTTAPISGLEEYSASCMMFAVMLSDSCVKAQPAQQKRDSPAARGEVGSTGWGVQGHLKDILRLYHVPQRVAWRD